MSGTAMIREGRVTVEERSSHAARRAARGLVAAVVERRDPNLHDAGAFLADMDAFDTGLVGRQMMNEGLGSALIPST